MSAIDSTISIMKRMSEENCEKVLDYVKFLYISDTIQNPYEPLSSDEILAKLALSRKQIADGKGISMEKALKKIGTEHGFI